MDKTFALYERWNRIPAGKLMTVGNPDAFGEVYVNKSGSDYIGPFWTIKYEFLGYILALLLAMTLKNNKYRRFLYVAVSMLIMVLSAIDFPLVDMHYVVFIMGLFVADFAHLTPVFMRENGMLKCQKP